MVLERGSQSPWRDGDWGGGGGASFHGFVITEGELRLVLRQSTER